MNRTSREPLIVDPPGRWWLQTFVNGVSVRCSTLDAERRQKRRTAARRKLRARGKMK